MANYSPILFYRLGTITATQNVNFHIKEYKNQEKFSILFYKLLDKIYVPCLPNCAKERDIHGITKAMISKTVDQNILSELLPNSSMRLLRINTS